MQFPMLMNEWNSVYKRLYNSPGYFNWPSERTSFFALLNQLNLAISGLYNTRFALTSGYIPHYHEVILNLQKLLEDKIFSSLHSDLKEEYCHFIDLFHQNIPESMGLEQFITEWITSGFKKETGHYLKNWPYFAEKVLHAAFHLGKTNEALDLIQATDPQLFLVMDKKLLFSYLFQTQNTEKTFTFLFKNGVWIDRDILCDAVQCIQSATAQSVDLVQLFKHLDTNNPTYLDASFLCKRLSPSDQTVWLNELNVLFEHNLLGLDDALRFNNLSVLNNYLHIKNQTFSDIHNQVANFLFTHHRNIEPAFFANLIELGLDVNYLNEQGYTLANSLLDSIHKVPPSKIQQNCKIMLQQITNHPSFDFTRPIFYSFFNLIRLNQQIPIDIIKEICFLAGNFYQYQFKIPEQEKKFREKLTTYETFFNNRKAAGIKKDISSELNISSNLGSRTTSELIRFTH